MRNEHKDTGRRELVRSIAVGSGVVIAGKTLAEHWVKPVLDSVLLPTHAATSVPLNYFGRVVVNRGGSYQLCIQCRDGRCTAQVLETYPGDGPEAYFYQGSGTMGASMVLTQPNNCDEYSMKLTVASANMLAIGDFDLIDDEGNVEDSAAFKLSQAECAISQSDANCVELAKLKSTEGSREHGKEAQTQSK